MHAMTVSRRLRAGFASALVAALVGCGGGGGGAPAAVPPPAPPGPLDPPVDGTPAVRLDAPAPLADGLRGTITLAATASDDVGVAAVEFQIDGEPVGPADTAAPYEVQVDTTPYPAGQHVVRARARDTSGNLSPWSAATVRFTGGELVHPAFTRDEAFVPVGQLGPSSAFAQAPDGRFFVCEQGGALRVVKDGAVLATPFHRFTVDGFEERGLLGVAFHPDFAANGFVYVYYTVPGAPAHNRISRVVANGDVSTGVETVLWDLPPLNANVHNGGALHFGADGKLYAAVGDGADVARAQDPADPFGKMLRFDADGSIPGDNPFCTAQALRCAVWALGLRNPFTFAVEPGTGRLFINDVGAGAWEEINVGQRGANYGWPAVEGPGPGGPPGSVAPLFAYPHAEHRPPGSGPGGFLTGFALTGGAFYPASGPFPAAYRRNYFFADFAERWIARLDPANDNAVYTFANLANVPVDLRVGQDGALYVLARAGGIMRFAAR